MQIHPIHTEQDHKNAVQRIEEIFEAKPGSIEWVDGVFDHCQKLSNHPENGRIVPEFKRPEIRELGHIFA